MNKTIATTAHTHAVAFGRKVDGCPRCAELKLGMPARAWGGYSSRGRASATSLADIRAHSCKAAGCMSICTFGDY